MKQKVQSIRTESMPVTQFARGKELEIEKYY